MELQTFFAWLNILGLVLDFIGALLLLIEWKFAFKERRDAEVAASMIRGINFSGGKHVKRERSKAEAKVHEKLKPRMTLYRYGLAFVALVFFLQIVSTLGTQLS